MIVAGALIYGGWKLERWINWKFDYGSRVDEQIQQLERRIEKLEKANFRTK